MTNKQALKKERGTPKDVFAHLLSTVTLAMSVVAFTTIWWQIANIQIPDPLSYSYTGSVSLIRLSIAVLIVGWPIYLFMARIIHKDIVENPNKQDIHVRKWLMYLTLFVSSIAIIIDLVTLINSFLGGALTTLFTLKLIAVFVSAGSVFGYYLWDVRRDVSNATKVPLIATLVSSTLILVSLIGGFLQIGTPAQQRKIQLDEIRVNDLTSLQYSILNSYEASHALPDSLESLSSSGWTIPTDPETEASYEYTRVAETTFELCANFSTASEPVDRTRTSYKEYGFLTVSDWTHNAERTCFTRTVDPSVLTPKTP